MTEPTNGTPSPAPGALANLPPERAALVGLFAQPDRPVAMSFDPTTPEGGRLLEKCEETPDDSLRELANMRLKLQHVYAKVFDYVNAQTGETYPLLRICLITTEGKVHACCADGVRESIARLILKHKLPPWKNGVDVTVKLKPTKKGFNRLVLLEYADEKKGGTRT